MVVLPDSYIVRLEDACNVSFVSLERVRLSDDHIQPTHSERAGPKDQGYAAQAWQSALVCWSLRFLLRIHSMYTLDSRSVTSGSGGHTPRYTLDGSTRLLSMLLDECQLKDDLERRTPMLS